MSPTGDISKVFPMWAEANVENGPAAPLSSPLFGVVLTIKSHKFFTLAAFIWRFIGGLSVEIKG